MRKEFSNIVEEYLSANSRSVFITGDLGYAALENVRSTASIRFINAGVAEQNMVGVAAGIAYKGFEVFTYSIAPFAVYRCLEQIKIDVCIHELPVYVVGNGGGYGYGIMGATHHAIEDIACLSCLPNMTCWVPAFSEDVAYCFNQITSLKKPAYLRLGLGKTNPYIKGGQSVTQDINNIIMSDDPRVTVVTLGPIINNVLEAIKDSKVADIFTVLRIPIVELSSELIESVKKTQKVIIIEEHVQRGGLAEHLTIQLAKTGINNIKLISLHAKGYPNKQYGNQEYHQKQSGLDVENIRKQIFTI